MVEKTQNTVEKNQAADQEKLPENLRVKKGKEISTWGDWAVSFTNEVLVNWLLNSIISLGMTLGYNRLVKQNKNVQDRFDKWAVRSSATDATPEDIFKNKREKEDIVETGVMLIAGTILLVPYKYIRDNAQKLAYKFDKKFEDWGWQKKGTADAKAESRGETKDAPKEEKLSWVDLLIARTAGLFVAIGFGMVLENHASGKWFSGIHESGADKTKTTYLRENTADPEKVTGTKVDVTHRGKNYKKLGLLGGRWVSGSKFGKAVGLKTSTDPEIRTPTASEEGGRLVLKELLLTGALATTMPIVLSGIDWLRGKKSTKDDAKEIWTKSNKDVKNPKLKVSFKIDNPEIGKKKEHANSKVLGEKPKAAKIDAKPAQAKVSERIEAMRKGAPYSEKNKKQGENFKEKATLEQLTEEGAELEAARL